MFKNFENMFEEMTAKVSGVENNEKTNELKKKRKKIGTIMAICGFTGAFICFILFATAGVSAVGENGFTARILVPFFLIIPCFVVGSFGIGLINSVSRIDMSGVAKNILNKAAEKKENEEKSKICPYCNSRLKDDDTKCSNCGSQKR